MRWFLFAAALLASPIQALAGGFSRGDDPSWVDLMPLPPPDGIEALSLRKEASGGVFYVLVDSQVAWEGSDVLFYYRMATEVTDRAGLEFAATVQETYDPEFEDLVLTRLSVWRDGKEIDHSDDVKENVYRRETRLEAGIIDGALTVHFQVPDLRVGDIVDYSVVRRGREIVPGASAAIEMPLEYSVPVLIARHVANWPAAVPFVQRDLPPRISHRSSDAGDIVRHVWMRKANRPVKLEDLTPIESEVYASAQYGRTDRWDWIGDGLSTFYLADYPLTPEWEKRVDAIAASSPDASARAVSALRLVQDEIRYVGIEVGAGGYFARPPDQVIRNGFGDCKDKALLLRTILARMGVVSYVALTDLDAGYALPNRLPRLGAFDHMILAVRIDGALYFMDPTGSHEGGDLTDAVVPDYGHALIIDGRHEGLTPIPAGARSAWQSATTERFHFSFLGASLIVESEYGGMAANSRRYDWATRPAREIDDGFLAFYESRYPGVLRSRPTQMADDRERNIVRTTETYFIPRFAIAGTKLELDFPFAAENFASFLSDLPDRPRREPVVIGTMRTNRHRVEVYGAPIDFQVPEPVRLSNPAFDYSFSGTEGDNGDLSLEWIFRTKARLLPPDDVSVVLSDARAVYDSYWFSWDLRP